MAIGKCDHVTGESAVNTDARRYALMGVDDTSTPVTKVVRTDSAGKLKTQSHLHDGTGNAIGSTAGAAHVSVSNIPTVNANMQDGATNDIGSKNVDSQRGLFTRSIGDALSMAFAAPTSTGYVTLVAAPGAGVNTRLRSIWIINISGANKIAGLRCGASGGDFMYVDCPDGDSRQFQVPGDGYLACGDNEVLQVHLAAGTASALTVVVHAIYEAV